MAHGHWRKDGVHYLCGYCRKDYKATNYKNCPTLTAQGFACPKCAKKHEGECYVDCAKCEYRLFKGSAIPFEWAPGVIRHLCPSCNLIRTNGR